jgi:quinohemoprotein ethanol dehydrogenase
VVDADLIAGRGLYLAHCGLCHGTNLESGNLAAPDLRESALALDREAMWRVLHEGLLMKRGMPRFGELTRQDVDKLYNYVRATSREALGLRKPYEYPPLGGQGQM